MEKHKDEACDYYEIHEDSMEIINKTMPEETELEDLADLFKIFGDSTRIRILFVLFEMLFRRPVNRKVEAYIHLAGYLLLLGVMVYFTFHDVINIFA